MNPIAFRKNRFAKHGPAARRAKASSCALVRGSSVLMKPIFLLVVRQNNSGNIVLAIVFALAALMTAAGLLARTEGSVLGSLFSSESRESREAADYGLKTIISELSVTPNRKLLVANKNSSNNWIAPSDWTSLASSTQNPCAVTNTGVYVPPRPISGATDTSKAMVDGQTDKRYWLRSISYKNSSSSGSRGSVTFQRSQPSANWTVTSSGTYSTSSLNLAGVNRGYVELRVQGESSQGGKVSTAIVTKEFELVPKCCGRSFGYTYASLSSPQLSFGQDARACGAIGQGVLNLVTGALGNGVFNTNGKAFALWENQINTNQDQAITLNPIDAKALDSDTNLIPTTQELPPQITEPPGILNSACISSGSDIVLPTDGSSPGSSAACPSTAAPTPTIIYQRPNGSAGRAVTTTTTTGQGSNRVTTTTYSCTASAPFSIAPNTGTPIPSGSVVQSENGNTITPNYDECYVRTTRSLSLAQPYCNEIPLGSSQWYCRIRYVDGFNSRIIADTSGGKTVTLLFTDELPTASGGRTVLGGSATFAGTGGFTHLVNGVEATLSDASRFRIINDIVGSDFQLKGSSGALSGFFDLRYSDVFLYGGGANSNINLSGILWANNLTLSGNATLVNPPSGNCSVASPASGTTCGILGALYPSLFDSNPTNDVTRPAYDFTPRSIFNLRLF